MGIVMRRGLLARRTGEICAFLLLGVPGLGCAGEAQKPQTHTRVLALDPRTLDSAGATPAATGAGPARGDAKGLQQDFEGNGSAALNAGPGEKRGEPPPPRMTRIDPNARYATTYRPGGAALAAFDAAVSRGSIPAIYKDLVGDFGARYAPVLRRPEGAALAVQIDTERAALAPSGGPVNLRIAIRSSDALPARAALSVHLVLDVSGSMDGEAMVNAREAAVALVEKLGPQDDFSMVTFSNEAHVLVHDAPIGPHRGSVLAKIRAVNADGGTNISAGLDLGYKEAHAPGINPDAVRIVMLLSDGYANAGDTNPASLSERALRAFQDGVQTSAFGLGADFDAPLMSAIADRGAGGYYCLTDSTQIAPALTRELEARLVPVAQAVEVRVRLRPDVVPTRVFGSHMLDGNEEAMVRQQELAVDADLKTRDKIALDRQIDATGGMRFFVPAFARDDRHAMLLTLHLPSGVGERAIGSVEVRYKDRLRKRNVTEEIAVKIRYAESDASSAATVNSSVAATTQAFAAGDAILSAAGYVDRGDRREAAKILDERAALLERAAVSLNEPSLAEDGLRLARLSHAVDGAQRLEAARSLTVMLRGSSYGYLR